MEKQRGRYLSQTWDQSAGGHVDAGEDYEQAAYRELQEELGIENVELKSIAKYYTSGDYGKVKINRFNNLFVGEYDGEFVLQAGEVEKVKWFDVGELSAMLKENPENVTPGCLRAIKEYLAVTNAEKS